MDIQIRMAAFKWLEEQVLLHGDLLPRAILEQGFFFNGQRITLVGPQGIWKPKVLELPLSITTIVNGPYKDTILMKGLLEYRYRGTDPNHRDNAGLREVMGRNIPLVYFLGVEPGKYLAEWPVFIVEDLPLALTFRVLIDEKSLVENYRESKLGEALYGFKKTADYRRRYVTNQAIARLHQRVFRARVLTAYQEQCAFCRLRHPQLLDAAHIIPDKEEGGEPIIPNGLSLCKIHHAAFDSNFIGVNPDYQIIVREDILQELDGPMLRHGIQQMHEQKIILPDNRPNWPDRERLEIRFNKFKEVG
ncbi:MAG: HNH endonuclease [Dethiobacteria bacterium]